MIKIGITGGIGSGKSFVCKLFAKQGIEIFNSDDQVKSDIIVLKNNTYEGHTYILFEYKKTKDKIFWYSGAMTVLPRSNEK